MARCNFKIICQCGTLYKEKNQHAGIIGIICKAQPELYLCIDQKSHH